MSNLLPTSRYTPATVVSPLLHELTVRRRMDRLVREVEASARVSVVAARADAAVAEAKITAAARVTSQAATSAAMIHHYANALAAGDPILRDELRPYELIFRAGASQVLADLFSGYTGTHR
jgi:hypothetical protein